MMEMGRIKEITKAFLLCALVLILPLTADAGEIKLSLAASLKEAITELTDAFSKTRTGVTFQMNSGASGAIAKQIENGAPADIFISANMEWMDYLREKGVIDGKNISILAYNILVFIGRPDLKIKTLQDLVLLDKIAVASPKSAPAGEYAMAALLNAGLEKQLEKKLVMARDVRECIMYAERGEIDGAFVYATDAKITSDKTKILLTVPQDLYPRVTYPMGVTAKGIKNEDAKAFSVFLRTEKAKEILTKYGFIIE